MITFINTPEDRFDNLVDYPFNPHYVELKNGMQVHYVDEGPRDAKHTILLMHGEPSWSFLYRHMIPPLVGAGYRCIAPDLIGFGKSSKPIEQSDYTYASHLEWMQEWLDHTGIKDITLFCQDWGGLIGLRLLSADPDRFARLVVSNTMLPTGDRTPPEAFTKWQTFSQKVDHFPFEKVLQGATTTELDEKVLAAYRAPFPDGRYEAGAKIFPMLVPTSPDDPESQNNREAWKNVYRNWQKPCLTLFGDSDPVTSGGEQVFLKLVPGTEDQPHEVIAGGGHFIQEDRGPLLAEKIIAWIGA